MTSSPSIDVVIPLFNGSKWIMDIVDSLKQQTLKPKRIIIIDDHSTDDSVKVAKSIDGIELYSNPCQSGQCASARNFGLTKIKSELVAFLDQDDLLHEKHFELLAQVLNNKPEAVAAATLHTVFKDSDQPKFEVGEGKLLKENMWKLFPFSEYSEPSLILFRREVFEHTKWYETVPGLADHFIWNELTLNQTIYRLHVRTVGRRIHKDSFFYTMVKDPVGLIEDFKTTNDDLLKKVMPEVQDETQKKFILKRNSIIHDMASAGRALEENNSQQFSTKVEEIAATLSSEEQEFKDYITAEIWRMVKRLVTYRHQKENLAIIMFMHRSWPADHFKMLYFIEKRIVAMRPGLKFYISYLLSNPFQIRSLRLLLMAILAKIQRTS